MISKYNERIKLGMMWRGQRPWCQDVAYMKRIDSECFSDTYRLSGCENF